MRHKYATPRPHWADKPRKTNWPTGRLGSLAHVMPDGHVAGPREWSARAQGCRDRQRLRGIAPRAERRRDMIEADKDARRAARIDAALPKAGEAK